MDIQNAYPGSRKKRKGKKVFYHQVKHEYEERKNLVDCILVVLKNCIEKEA